MRIALLGYGKMGRLIEEMAVNEGWEVGPKLDVHNNQGGCGITEASMDRVDVALEFSQPDAVLANMEACARLGVNLVVGTTGWMESQLLHLSLNLWMLASAKPPPAEVPPMAIF